MIVDTSALMAILNLKPAAPALIRVIASQPGKISAATLLEAAIVADNRSPAHRTRFDDAIDTMGLAVVPVTATHYEIARHGYRRYGRGSGSPAQLNFGDCFAYALAIADAEPLLYVGNDFSHTDVTPAYLPA